MSRNLLPGFKDLVLQEDGSLLVGSRLAVGARAADYVGQVDRVLIYATDTFPETTGYLYGTYSSLVAEPAADTSAWYLGHFMEVYTGAMAHNFAGQQFGFYGFVRTNSTGALSGALHGAYGRASNAGVGNTVDEAYGLFGRLENDSTGTITQGTAVKALLHNDSTGEITTGYGVLVSTENNSTGEITTFHGVHIENPTNSGTLTTNVGLYIEAQTSGTTDYSIYSEGGDNYLGGDLAIGDGKKIKTDEIRARDGAGLKLYDDSGAVGVFVEDGGNVGIGTLSPEAKLEIEVADTDNVKGVLVDFNETGSYNAFLVDSESTTYAAIQSNGKYALRTDQDISDGYALYAIRNLNEGGSNPLVSFIDEHIANAQTTLYVRQDGTGDIVNLFDGGTEVFTVLNDGKVGINTSGPDRKLDVLDPSNPQLRLTHTDGSVYVDLQANTGGNLYIDPSGGRVGINTITPGTQLEIKGANLDNVDSFRISNAAGNVVLGDVIGDIQFYGNDASQWGTGKVAEIKAIAAEAWVGAGRATDLAFFTHPNGNVDPTEKMRILTDGKVGINTSGPDRKLDVLDPSYPQLRLTHTDGSVYVDLQAESDGDLSIEPTGSHINIIDKDILLSTSTGTKIGTTATQKIGLWGVTPVIQQAHIVDADGTLNDITTKFNTLLGYLEAEGILAA